MGDQRVLNFKENNPLAFQTIRQDIPDARTA